MRRAIETDYDYKHWFRDYNIDRPTITPNQLLFRLDPTQYFELPNRIHHSITAFKCKPRLARLARKKLNKVEQARSLRQGVHS